MKPLTVLVSVACIALVTVQAAAAEGVWIGGTEHGLVTGPPQGSLAHPVPLYIIAPVSPSHPLHPLADALPNGFGAHDHVAAKVFAGACDLMLVVPGPRAATGTVRTRMTLTPAGKKPLVYAVVMAGKSRPLTSVAAIHLAATAGLVAAVNTHNVIFCRVSA
jgi:hypothetical protein